MHRPLKVKRRLEERAKPYPDKCDTSTLVFMVYFLFFLSHFARSSCRIKHSLLCVCVRVLDSLSCSHCLTKQFLPFSFNLCYLCAIDLLPTHVKTHCRGLPLIWALIKTECRGQPGTYSVWLPRRVTVTVQAHFKVLSPLMVFPIGPATVCTLTNRGQEMSWVRWIEGTL